MKWLEHLLALDIIAVLALVSMSTEGIWTAPLWLFLPLFIAAVGGSIFLLTIGLAGVIAGRAFTGADFKPRAREHSSLEKP